MVRTPKYWAQEKIQTAKDYQNGNRTCNALDEFEIELEFIDWTVRTMEPRKIIKLMTRAMTEKAKSSFRDLSFLYSC